MIRGHTQPTKARQRPWRWKTKLYSLPLIGTAVLVQNRTRTFLVQFQIWIPPHGWDAVVGAIPKAIFLCSVNGGEHTEWTEEGGAAHVLACLFPS